MTDQVSAASNTGGVTITLPALVGKHVTGVATALGVSNDEIVSFLVMRGLLDIYDFTAGTLTPEAKKELVDDLTDMNNTPPLGENVPL